VCEQEPLKLDPRFC